ncbi:hypothetical protein GCM10027615_14740 [Plantactinospora veratri]
MTILAATVNRAEMGSEAFGTGSPGRDRRGGMSDRSQRQRESRPSEPTIAPKPMARFQYRQVATGYSMSDR